MLVGQDRVAPPLALPGRFPCGATLARPLEVEMPVVVATRGYMYAEKSLKGQTTGADPEYLGTDVKVKIVTVLFFFFWVPAKVQCSGWRTQVFGLVPASNVSLEEHQRLWDTDFTSSACQFDDDEVWTVGTRHITCLNIEPAKNRQTLETRLRLLKSCCLVVSTSCSTVARPPPRGLGAYRQRLSPQRELI